ncbi:hypothetical protein EOD42_15875 [Rhodovarius crocodyli]|uniref:DUF4347 domain-containing protein n=1 Tax=Rhodovarius crocodyli TaxID=1979269 RepID=A0A437MDG0_9PROT|nr:hypothetical protein [Rhodovarius crocodyli]RVT95675.1 hypothetical protein EOD42_15875 [Rhodovarius crocodyli]
MADIELRVLDTRIGARFRRPRPTDIIVGTTQPLADVITAISNGAGSGRISRLSICCHGYESGVESERAAYSHLGGGFGLQLGAGDLTWNTVSEFGALATKFAAGAIIDIYSCSAAEDSSDGTGFTGNGRALMRELAGYTGAIVRASDAPQAFTQGVVNHRLWRFTLYTSYEGVDFGEWEGTVWLFKPDGSRSRDKSPGRGVS